MQQAPEFKTLRTEIAGVSVARLAREFGGTPLFVYDAASIKRRVADLTSLGVFDVVRYAQKACSNIAILKTIRACGAAVDAVSAAEIRRALVAGFEPKEIAYTADVFDADALELVAGDTFGCVVNCGSPDMIAQLGAALGERAQGFKLTIRVNPGFGHGHSAKTNTGGDLSKHGVWFEQIGDCVATAERFGMTINGLHLHIGSGSDFEHLAQVAGAAERFAAEIGDTVESVSCGGGLPIPYRSGEEYVDLNEYAALWAKTKAALEAKFGRKIELEIEPGRYLVAESGYLVAQIRAVKKQAENVFYLVDAGFTHLARPTLYGSYHPISVAFADAENASNDGAEEDAIVGGPLCESGDVFTQEEGGYVVKRRLPKAAVGDFLILEVAGAYGAAMSSNYNSKFLAPEVLIENGEPRLIRRKQTFEHLIANEIF